MSEAGGDDAEARLLARLTPHVSTKRVEARGGLAFVQNRPSWAADVLLRGAAREALGEKSTNNGTAALDPLREIRYFSGPWEGAGSELMPVSWFLLWRSNVDWIPDPAYMKKEASGRGKLAAPSKREKTAVPQRSRPADFKHRPAGSRTMPRDAAASRVKPFTEE